MFSHYICEKKKNQFSFSGFYFGVRQAKQPGSDCFCCCGPSYHVGKWPQDSGCASGLKQKHKQPSVLPGSTKEAWGRSAHFSVSVCVCLCHHRRRCCGSNLCSAWRWERAMGLRRAGSYRWPRLPQPPHPPAVPSGHHPFPHQHEGKKWECTRAHTQSRGALWLTANTDSDVGRGEQRVDKWAHAETPVAAPMI